MHLLDLTLYYLSFYLSAIVLWASELSQVVGDL
jgi:hypothetical protein